MASRKRKVASIDPITGATVTGFTANANSAATAVAVTNSTVYIGGQFSHDQQHASVGLAAVNATTGSSSTGFVNDMSGGIGVNGLLTVQALVLTPDLSKLLVVHTGRQVAGQDRYGVGLINTARPTSCCRGARVCGTTTCSSSAASSGSTRARSRPNGEYFVVTSGSGGDRPPINDTAVAFPIDGGDDVQPLWISRLFDSVYSVAISEIAVYVGGHFNYAESPTSPDPWPGLTNVGYGRGQGLAGYGLGDDIVIRDHIGALDPADRQGARVEPGLELVRGQQGDAGDPAGSDHRW